MHKYKMTLMNLINYNKVLPNYKIKGIKIFILLIINSFHISYYKDFNIVYLFFIPRFFSIKLFNVSALKNYCFIK